MKDHHPCLQPPPRAWYNAVDLASRIRAKGESQESWCGDQADS